MPKRKSEETLEEIANLTSPNSKKIRFEDIPEEIPPSNTNGETKERDERNGNDILAAADQEREMLEEAAGDDISDESSMDDDEGLQAAPLRQSVPTEGYGDLYLDTINRSILDFDFEKLCSVTLSNINVYACLVCGKYYQGRGPKSNAYFHSLEVGHHVFINMESKKVFVLPEGYEVLNQSLDDIKYVVDPKFSEVDVKKLDRTAHESTDLANKRYRPGFIGMNNIKANDYLNVVVQALAHVSPIRNFFMLHPFPPNTPQLVIRFGTLVRKLWNARAFRDHVSPHELLQEIAVRSSKRFTLTNQSDPVEFLSWFLNNLHLALGGSKTKPFSSIIQKIFQGKLRMESQAITARSDATGDRLRFEESSTITSNITPYLILTLDLPPAPLFRDAIEAKNIIPQVPLTTLLQKYSGLQASEKLAHRVRHRLLHPLPPYLFFHIKRFSVNKFVSERNPTIVTFPSPRGLDMSPYVEPNPSIHPPGEPIYYEMVANIILDTTSMSSGGGEDSNAADAANKAVGGDGEKVAWKVQVRDKGAAAASSNLPEWLEIQDLWVQRAEAETLFTREGYLMVWERKTAPKGAKVNGKGKQKSAAAPSKSATTGFGRKPTSNGFSLPTTKSSRFGEDSDDEVEAAPKHEEVSGFDSTGGAIAIKPTTQKQEFVIPSKGNGDWRNRGKGKNILPEEVKSQQAQNTNGNSLVEREEASTESGLQLAPKREDPIIVTTGSTDSGTALQTTSEFQPIRDLNEDEAALNALLREGKGEITSNRVIEQNRSSAFNEVDDYRTDVASRPDSSTLEEYAAMPVEEFGMALLRGMGTKRRANGEIVTLSQGDPPKVKESRAGYLGIGAKGVPTGAEIEVGAWGKADMRKNKRGEGLYTPVLLRDKRTGETLTEEELAARKKEAKGKPEEDWRERRDRNLQDRGGDGYRSQKNGMSRENRSKRDRSRSRSKDRDRRYREGDGWKPSDKEARDRIKDRHKDKYRDSREKDGRSRDRDLYRDDDRYDSSSSRRSDGHRSRESYKKGERDLKRDRVHYRDDDSRHRDRY